MFKPMQNCHTKCVHVVSRTFITVNSLFISRIGMKVFFSFDASRYFLHFTCHAVCEKSVINARNSIERDGVEWNERFKTSSCVRASLKIFSSSISINPFVNQFFPLCSIAAFNFQHFHVYSSCTQPHTPYLYTLDDH